MDSNTIRNLIALLIVGGAALIPAFVVYNMVRPMKKNQLKDMGNMNMNVRGVKLPSEEKNDDGVDETIDVYDNNDLGSAAGRW
ncbi:MAG: hypothetical protein KKC99_02185 [Proteobacteria bacterium]|nr:hypothetical protein [Pseudomonadota bacterium]